ncbi:olfactory receptor 6F1-like [Spea bombifrons]|uniref:olfactory receptor 6F1-like n=1 Tax=Spea bombifrons TaxID=233779 RepID=UPI00234A72E7|nr:olfactory receptor 6F1-like [Spea bombifrons]
MGVVNISEVVDFVLLGFPVSQKLKILIFTFILASYCIILVANIVIVTVVKKFPHLYVPMYIFISNFSLMEICCTTIIIPKMLTDLVNTKESISFNGCLIQFYFILFSGAMENILLAMMGYDRYLAICHPLHYSSIMTHTVCYRMAAGSWITSFLMPIMPTIAVSKLSFCDNRKIDHFFCDFGALVKLSCSTTAIAAKIFFGQAWILILSCSSVTFISYIYIIYTVLKIPTHSGRKKAFSTCVSHLTVVGIFYGTLFFMYVRPSESNTTHLDKGISVFYTVVAPLLNPIIYSLRNANIKTALNTMLQKQWGVKRTV